VQFSPDDIRPNKQGTFSVSNAPEGSTLLPGVCKISLQGAVAAEIHGDSV